MADRDVLTDALGSSTASLASHQPPPAARPSRDVLRDRERRSRQRRVARLAAMESHVRALEQAALVVRLPPETDTNAKQTAMRRALRLAKEAQQLVDEKKALQRLLTERELWRRTVERLLAVCDGTDGSVTWEVQVRRWLALTRLHFVLWTNEQLDHARREAVREMQQFRWSTKKQTTGVNFMGWYDERLVSASAKSFTFGFRKTYTGFDPQLHVAFMWKVYSDTETYSRMVLNGRGHCVLDVVQRLSPSAWIVRLVENYHQMADFNVHNLYVLFHVASDDGGTCFFLRSIDAPAVQRATNGASDVWTRSVFWIRVEPVDAMPNRSRAFQVSLGGSLYGDDPAFASRWLIEALGILLRCEATLCKRPLLHFD